MSLVWLHFRSGLFYKVGQTGMKWTTYFEPFKLDVWLGFVFSMLFMGICYTLLVEKSQTFDHKIFLVFQSGLCQGTNAIPRRGPSRIIFCSMFGLGLLIWSAYSSVLTSYLAVKLSTPPFVSLEDMLHKTSYKIVTPPSTAFVDRFKVHKIPNYCNNHHCAYSV